MYKIFGFYKFKKIKNIKLLKKTNNIEIYHKKLNAVLNKVRKLKVIKVSIINDFCIGAGFIFAMYTDICIVNDNCVFSVPASKLNIKLDKSQLDFLLNKFPKNKLLNFALLKSLYIPDKFSESNLDFKTIFKNSTMKFNFEILSISRLLRLFITAS